MQLNRRTRAAPIARRAADLVWALRGRRCGAGWICRCPAHDDHHPSLSIAERDGKVLIKCWSGCGQDEVLDALRQRGLWEGKARETSQAGRPHALIAKRETSLKPCDPMKTFRNAGLFARRSPAGRYLENSRNQALRRRGLEPAFCTGAMALADAIALAGHAGARVARHRRGDRHPPDIC